MKRVLVLLIVSLGLNISAAEPDKLWESLRSELRAEVKARQATDKQDDKSPVTPSQLNRMEFLLSQIPAAGEVVKDEQLWQMIQTLEQLSRVTLSEKVSALCRSLAASLKERNETQLKALKDRCDKTLHSALDLAFKATTPQELDGPLTELAHLKQEVPPPGYHHDGLNPAMIQSVEGILAATQDGLLAAEHPDNGRSSSISTVGRLQSEASSAAMQTGELMPRSEFHEKMRLLIERLSPPAPKRPLPFPEFEKQVQALVASVKTLNDLAGVLDKLEVLSGRQREANGYYGEPKLMGELRDLRKIYDSLRAGEATSVTFSSQNLTPASHQTEPLFEIKNLLVKFALTRVLSAPEGLAPKQDESAADFLQRVYESARRTSDWPLMDRVFDTEQTIGLANLAPPNDAAALRGFLGGMNLEHADQFSAAVSAYLGALKTGSQVLPMDKIRDTLAALKKDHPQDYESGVRLSDSPPPGSKHGKGSSAHVSNVIPSSFTLVIPGVTEKGEPLKRPQ
ncbi:MAG: hypothetical protein JWO94_37 [Verrucomicrobiaceae bacterium]|nr:hypothetical protein [Verrucomicrobiaceae bacterium]